MTLPRILGICAIFGTVLPPFTVWLWFALHMGDIWSAGSRYLYQHFGMTDWSGFIVGVSLGALINVPVYMALGAVLWFVFRPRPS